MFYKKIGMLLLAVTLSMMLTACSHLPLQAALRELYTPGKTVSKDSVLSSSPSDDPVEKVPFSPEESHQMEWKPLSLFQAKDGDSVWQDGSLLCSTDWEYFYLSQEDAAVYPALAAALDVLNQETAATGAVYTTELSETARENFQVKSADDVYAWYSQENAVRRADQAALSFLHYKEYFDTVSYGSTVRATNLDPATGKELTLADVFVHPEELPELLDDQYRANGQSVDESTKEYFASCISREEFIWVVGYQNVTFYFSPPYDSVYADNLLTLTLWFQDSPHLFQEKFRSFPSQYVVKLDSHSPIDIDLNSQDNRKDTIWYESYTGWPEIWVNDQFCCTLPDDEIDADIPLRALEVYFVQAADEHHLLYIDAAVWNDCHVLSIYSLDDARLLERYWDVGFYEEFTEEGERRRELFTDPSDFTLYAHMELLGTMWGVCTYQVDPSSGLAVEKSPYFDVINDNTLTTLIPLEAIALPDEIHETIPAGTNLYFLRTDCLSYVDMQAEDGQEWRIYLDTSQWPITVNGISIDQCFDGIFYLG